VDEEEIAVGEHLIDERIDDLRPGRGGQGVVPEGVQLVEQVGAERVQAQVQLEEDVLLALEVALVTSRRSAISRSDVLS
jgi:hypothetical protein